MKVAGQLLAVLTVAFATAASAATMNAQSGYFPFADLSTSFWRLPPDATTKFPDLVVWIEPNSLEIESGCHLGGLAFGGVPSAVRFSNYFLGTAISPTCDAADAQFDLLKRKTTKIASYELNGDRLSFLDNAQHEIISLKRILPAGPENRMLRVISFLDSGHLATPLPSSKSVVIFFNGELDGSPGCGGLIGTYRRTGTRDLRIYASWALAGMCYDMAHVSLQNNAVTKDLNDTRWMEEPSPNHFVLRDGNGTVRIVLAGE